MSTSLFAIWATKKSFNLFDSARKGIQDYIAESARLEQQQLTQAAQEAAKQAAIMNEHKSLMALSIQYSKLSAQHTAEAQREQVHHVKKMAALERELAVKQALLAMDSAHVAPNRKVLTSTAAEIIAIERAQEVEKARHASRIKALATEKTALTAMNTQIGRGTTAMLAQTTATNALTAATARAKIAAVGLMQTLWPMALISVAVYGIGKAWEHVVKKQKLAEAMNRKIADSSGLSADKRIKQDQEDLETLEAGIEDVRLKMKNLKGDLSM